MKVMCFGSFDHVHKGHEFFLREAKKKGDELVVVIARDKTINKVKGSLPDFSAEERKKHVEALGLATVVRLGSEQDKYAVIEEEQPDIICLGYDQTAFTETLEEEMKKRNIPVEIIRLPAYHPEKYKSSKIKLGFSK